MLRGIARMLEPVGAIDAGVGRPRARRGRGRQRAAGAVVMLTVWAALAGSTAMARDPDPPLRIPLEPIGYEPLQPEFLLAGSPMLTVDFVDNDHLLLTFGV